MSRKLLFLALATTMALSVNAQKDATIPPVIQQLIDNMVLVEGGTFMMGGTAEQGAEASEYEFPIHEVTVSSFYIGKYEVTQEEWEAVMGENPSRFPNPKHPVDQVSYRDCQKFIRKLSRIAKKRFRMPTEAEWEFAARGGKLSKGYKYAGSNDIKEVAWLFENSNNGTQDVGLKKPNELGLYDMSGNVWEWCNDLLGNYSYAQQKNPVGAYSGTFYVFRGGSWVNEPWYARVSMRNGNQPRVRGVNLGLRLAL